jgi:hypothetical protein
MSKYISYGVTINNKNAITNGKSGFIDSWDNKAKKYKVIFDQGWCGWYKKSELIIDKQK